jgi:hypothetical protein
MEKVYDAVVVTGEYQDSSGQTKKRYMNVGVVLKGDKGLSLKLEAVPVNFNGWINFYEPKPRENGRAATQPQQSPGRFEDDDMPRF